MHINELKAKSVFSYEKFNLLFDNKVYLVLGKINDNVDKSNGAGKTSIINILHKALYDKTIKKGIRDISMNHCGDMKIAVMFDDKKIIRGMAGGKNYVELYENDEKLVEKKTNFADDFVDYELFKLITTFTTKHNFFVLDDSVKKDLIISLTNNDIIDRVYDRVSEDLKRAEEKNFDLLIEEYTKSLITYDETKKNFKLIESKMEKLLKFEEYISAYQHFLRARQALFEQYFEHKENYIETLDKGKKLRSVVDGIKKIDLEKQLNEMSEYKENISKHESTIGDIEEKIEFIQEGKCPATGEICKDIKDNKKMLEKYNDKIKDCKGQIKINNDLLETKKLQYVERKQKKEADDEILLEYNKTKAKFEEIKKSYMHDRKLILELYMKYNKYFEAKFYDITQGDINDAKFTYSQLKERLASLNEMKEKLVSLKEAKQKNDEKVEKLREIKKIFSKDCIKQFVLQKVTDFLVEQINEIVSKVFENMEVDIKLEFSGKRNLMNIEIKRDDSVFDIEELSSGEQVILQLAFQLALNNLYELSSGQSINVLFIDEVLDLLDKTNVEKVADIVKLLSELNKTVFVISHNEYVKKYFEHFVVVSKNEGTSALTQN